MKMLKELYLIHSPSKSEHLLRGYIRELLKANDIPYHQDRVGNLYNLDNKDGMFCAHMDQVQVEGPDKIILHKNALYGVAEGPKERLVGLGADDKNGIWIALKVILGCLEKKQPIPSFLFTVGEEAGATGSRAFVNDKQKELETMGFCLVFDRRGSKDIIGVANGYCEHDLQKEVETLGKKWAYKPATGVFSDCDVLSKHVACVNLSCGYHDAHSGKEYTDINEIRAALKLAKKLWQELPRKKYKISETSIFDRESSYTWNFADDAKAWDYSWDKYGKLSKDGSKGIIKDLQKISDKMDYINPAIPCETCHNPIELDMLEHGYCPLCAEKIYDIYLEDCLDSGQYFDTVLCPFCQETTWADEPTCCMCEEKLTKEN